LCGPSSSTAEPPAVRYGPLEAGRQANGCLLRAGEARRGLGSRRRVACRPRC
jgi:hypothetical protein